MNFESVWQRIRAYEGANFRTVSGKEFTYIVKGDALTPSRANQNISRRDFEKVYAVLKTLSGPGDISSQVRGSSYIYAILTDKRIVG